MEVDEALKAKIAEMEARLGRSKPPPQTAPFAPYPQYQGNQYHQGGSPYRGGRGHFSGRWAARGGRGAFHGPHRNNTLIVNKSGSTEQAKDGGTSPEDTSKVHIQKRGFHQLINKSSNERNEEQHQRNELVESPIVGNSAEQQGSHEVKAENTAEVKPTVIVKANQEMEIDGVDFRIARDGSKIERVGAGQSWSSHEQHATKLNFYANLATKTPTPKMLVLHGVAYHRTKRGNLRRKQDKKPLARYQESYPLGDYSYSRQFIHRSAPRKQCETFSKKGTYCHKLPPPRLCKEEDLTADFRGMPCAFAHDPDKVAVCKTYLFTGSCDKGEDCDLSHDTTYARAPACTFFVSGNCTNPACRYPHVKVSSSAPLCLSFGRLGYCAKGDRCEKRHIFDECPEYTNTGSCKLLEANKKCELQHIDRASTMRKREQREAKRANEDVSDSEDEKEEAVTDSDGFEEDDVIMTGLDNDIHELTQQQDFVSFD